MEHTDVHLLTVLVVDKDHLDTEDVIETLEHANYSNDCIYPQVVNVATQKIAWHDGHPLNNDQTKNQALTELFGFPVLINSITIVTEPHGPDYVYLKTNLPDGRWPFSGVSDLKMTVGKDLAEDYVAKHFPNVPVEVIHG